MKKLFTSAFALSLCLCGFSQDIYQVAELSTTDLNGTARYVGMGGAMGALGGDLSTMSSNPAATGLYRRSDVAVTGSLVVQPGADKFDGECNTHASFDQLGFVYALPVFDEGMQFLNFGINYRKQRNFNQLINSVNENMAAADYASQTWQLSDLSNYWGSPDDATPLTGMAREAYLLGDKESGYSAYGASETFYSRWRKGSNQAFDFNISTNINDQWYIGLTATVYNVNQKSFTAYGENLVTSELEYGGLYDLGNEYRLTGTGYDAKFGVIVRPIVTSNFKIGVSLTTPTYYDLRNRKDALLVTQTAWSDGKDVYAGAYYDYDYKVRTPWKVNVSMGNTFFNQLALGVEYEFADHSSSSVSYGDDLYDWDYWNSEKDRELNRQIDKYLKGTHTIKAGLEWNFAKGLYLRGGYNHVTSPIDADAYLNQYINSASVDAATSTDFVNLSSLNRYTAGLGFKYGGFYADLAWQYQNQHGNLYTFATQAGNHNEPNSANECPGKRVNLNKSQVMLTLGYRF